MTVSVMFACRLVAVRTGPIRLSVVESTTKAIDVGMPTTPRSGATVGISTGPPPTAVGGGPVLIPTVAPLLGVVGIPTSMALVVLSTTDNLIGPVRTATSLQANITLTVMAARRGKEKPEAPAAPVHFQENHI